MAGPSYRQEIRGYMQGPTGAECDESGEKQWNRLSRLHPQLQEHHQKKLWKHYLYELQQSAPTPRRVICRYAVSTRPAHYGREFHGIMSRDEADQLLLEEDGVDGRYLVRESARTKGQMTLSLRFQGLTRNFRLLYCGGQHYVNEAKRFDTLHDLVADGLISLHVEANATEYIANLAADCRYEESPYMTLHKSHLAHCEPGRPRQRRCLHSADRVRQITSHEELAERDEQCGQATSVLNVQAFEKSHHFRTHTFIGSPWCDFCGNFIWGLIGQGVRCEDCGFGAHRKCSELVPNDCCPDLRHIRRVFGIDLTAFVKASNSPRPFVVDLCVAQVERRGFRTEGIYRACGSNEQIEQLKNRFEVEWEKTEAYLASVEDIHVVTGLLKLYLRLLPIPLITFDSYQSFVQSAKRSDQEQVVSGLREAVSGLPPAHYQTLKHLMMHLNRVTAYEHYNLMSAKNLGLIFGQTLIYTPNIPMMFQLSCWEVESKTVELLIVFAHRVFLK